MNGSPKIFVNNTFQENEPIKRQKAGRAEQSIGSDENYSQIFGGGDKSNEDFSINEISPLPAISPPGDQSRPIDQSIFGNNFKIKPEIKLKKIGEDAQQLINAPPFLYDQHASQYLEKSPHFPFEQNPQKPSLNIQGISRLASMREVDVSSPPSYLSSSSKSEFGSILDQLEKNQPMDNSLNQIRKKIELKQVERKAESLTVIPINVISPRINQKTQPQKLQTQIQDQQDHIVSPDEVKVDLEMNASPEQVPCHDMYLLRYYQISTQDKSCDICYKTIESQVFMRQKVRDMLFHSAKALNLGLCGYSCFLMFQFQRSTDALNTLISGSFFIIQVVLDCTRSKFLNLNKDKIHENENNLNINHIKQNIKNQHKMSWVVLRYIQLIILMLGLHILWPSDSQDLNVELQKMAINDNMGKVSMVFGIFYALVFPETSQGAAIVQSILTLAQCISILNFYLHFKALANESQQINTISWSTYTLTKLLEILSQIFIVMALRCQGSLFKNIFVQCHCQIKQPSPVVKDYVNQSQETLQNKFTEKRSMMEESLDQLIIKSYNTDNCQLKNLMIGTIDQMSLCQPNTIRKHSTQHNGSFLTNKDKNERMGFDIAADIVFDHLNKSLMLCKLSTVDQSLSNKILRKSNTSNIKSSDIQSVMKSYLNTKLGNQITLDILKITQEFFSGIPIPKILQRVGSMPLEVDGDNTLKKIKSANSKIVAMNNLDLNQTEKLNHKVFIPYYISNNTIIEFEKWDANSKLSLMDIIQTYFNSKKVSSKYYFKVLDLEDEENSDKSVSEASMPLLASRQSLKTGQQEATIDQFYKNSPNQQTKMQELESHIQYFEVELKQIVIKGEKHYLITVNDLTSIIKSQQKLSDDMYQDAIESNYSHEQMTPLNCILAQSKIVSKRYMESQNLLKQYFKLMKDPNGMKQQETKAKETLKLLQAIQQSGQAMWYYNTNQIQRMKIRKNEFKTQLKNCKNPDEHIQKVIYPFEPHIQRQGIKVFFARTSTSKIEIKANWIMYQLILFNIIQNSVKYNQFNGDIIILLECLPISHEAIQKPLKKQKSPISQTSLKGFNFMLETHIIDTGIGIEEDRQKMLFIPFLELKMKQNLKQVKDNNIGLGLACSQAITGALHGDIQISQSQRGLTVFAFKIPVKVNEESPIGVISRNSQNYELQPNLLQNKNFSEGLVEFLEKRRVIGLRRLTFNDSNFEESKQADQVALNKIALQRQKKQFNPMLKPKISSEWSSGILGAENHSVKNQPNRLLNENRAPRDESNKPKEQIEMVESYGHLMVMEQKMKNERSSSVSDYSLSPQKLQNLTKLQLKAKQIKDKNLLDLDESFGTNKQPWSNNINESYVQSESSGLLFNNRVSDCQREERKVPHLKESNRLFLELPVEEQDDEEKKQFDQEKPDEQINSSSKDDHQLNQRKQQLSQTENSVYDDVREQEEIKIPSSRLVSQSQNANEESKQQALSPNNGVNSKLKIASLQNPIEYKYNQKSLSKLRPNEKIEIAKNLLMANQKNSLLKKLSKYNNQNTSQGFVISKEDSQVSQLSQLQIQEFNSLSDDSVRDININPKIKRQNKSMDFSNSQYSSSNSLACEEVKQEPVPMVRRESSLESIDVEQENVVRSSLPVIGNISENEEEDKEESDYAELSRQANQRVIKPEDFIINSKDLAKQLQNSSDNPGQVVQESNCTCQPRILVVDDTSFNLMAVKCMIFENFQLGIDEAVNGKIALDMYKERYELKCGCQDRTYKLIIMDLQMPVMGGVEASQEIMKLVRQDLIDRAMPSSRKVSSNSKALSNYVNSQKFVLNDAAPSSMISVINKDVLLAVEQEILKEENQFQPPVDSQLTHIVALTSYTNENIKQECLAVGIKKVIYKPLQYKQLHQIMWKHYFRVDPQEYKNIYKSAFDNQSLEQSDEDEEQKQQD